MQLDPSLLTPSNERQMRGLTVTRVGEDLVISRQREDRSRSSSEGSEMSVSDTASSVGMDSTGSGGSEESEDFDEGRDDDSECSGYSNSRSTTSFVDFRNPASWCDDDMLTMIGIFPREFDELCQSLEGCSSSRMALSHQARVFLFKTRKLFHASKSKTLN